MISLSSPTFYKNGEAGQSQVVGFESLVTRVARFAFVTPPQGADTVSFEFEGVEKGAGYDIGLRWHITADPASHANAGASAAYAGQVTLSGRWGRGEGQLLLLPNTTYYLWLFPGEDLWGWYYWPVKGQLTLSGASQSIPSLSHTTAALGQTVRITTNRMGDFTHTLTWQLGSGSGTIAEM